MQAAARAVHTGGAMKRVMMALGAAALVSTWCETSSAQAYVAEDVVLFASAPIGGLGVVLTFASLGYLTGDDPLMSTAWAVTAIVGGALELALGATSLVAALADLGDGLFDAVFDESDQATGWLAGWAALGLAFGGLHLAHGIVSLTSGPRPPNDAISVSIAPRGDGAMLGLVGSF